MMQYPRHGR